MSLHRQSEDGNYGMVDGRMSAIQDESRLPATYRASLPGAGFLVAMNEDGSQEMDCPDLEDDEVGDGDSSSTASAIPPLIEHPDMAVHNRYLVYFEPREFHKSANEGQYNFQGRLLNERTVHNMLIRLLTPPSQPQGQQRYLYDAMVRLCPRRRRSKLV